MGERMRNTTRNTTQDNLKSTINKIGLICIITIFTFGVNIINFSKLDFYTRKSLNDDIHWLLLSIVCIFLLKIKPKEIILGKNDKNTLGIDSLFALSMLFVFLSIIGSTPEEF
ncbi:hypothetical protein [Clostridium peptidivorans]|uniref:hypothetical protein n=1 Tax=Clostridium peptidivorans TaxID=100174 RepID=UPI000BE2E011|nr:hypothetical protein [Clostridium peptidivorans]